MTSLPKIEAHHYVLAVPDAEQTARYFVDALGFERVPVGDPGWRFVRKDACMIMLGSCPDATPPAALGDHAYFGYLVVSDVDAYHRHLASRGSVTAPVDKPWGMREMPVRTPDGHRLMIGQRLA